MEPKSQTKSELLKTHYMGKQAYHYSSEDSLLVDILLRENRSLRNRLRAVKREEARPCGKK